MTTGEKIKTLRKELKLTQSQLAGEEMTKSMLSQIENNNAMPSMKNLRYLANKLGRPISYFLDEDTLNEDIPVDEIKRKMRKADEYAKRYEKEKVVEILDGILQDYNINEKSKLYADILYKNGIWKFPLNEFEIGEKCLREAVEIYKANNLYSNAAKAYIELMGPFWQTQDFEKSLKILDEAYEIYLQSTTEDITFHLEYLFNKSLVLSTLGRMNETYELVDKAIEISKESGVYYNTGEFYRMRGNLGIVMEDYGNVLYYLEKAMQFAEFTDNKFKLSQVIFNYGNYYCEIDEPKKAIEYLKKSLEIFPDSNKHLKHLYYIDLAICYYKMGEYKKALEEIIKTKYSDVVYHKFDYVFMWSGKVYEGLILFNLGESDKALESIYKGIEMMSKRGNSKHLAFAYKKLSDIYSKLNDYEKAFKTLKKSEEITKELNGNPL
ncbi:helix-turn-helix transcriptional regulator [Clostridium sp. D2Q-11]|uniref:Helix-turn-helix transcriptional regulator n=1 Tax=Anaeromonas frigoriresistens TaxID=2683708 RepID=A0A942V399_9FIRM|nr:helix-turn-helix transcriptional regulator [Anaeromonas frigoriresistens]MBS4539162.1 helix-turn-helix transcriptional regulator [Anaeromonas frigoriresistens]